MGEIDTLDLAEYKSANGAAKAAGEKIKEIAEALDQDPELEVTVEKRTSRHGHKWIVSWPGGPFDWAVVLTGGESLYAGEMPSTRMGENNPQIKNMTRHDQPWQVECKNGTTLAFYPQ